MLLRLRGKDVGQGEQRRRLFAHSAASDHPRQQDSAQAPSVDVRLRGVSLAVARRFEGDLMSFPFLTIDGLDIAGVPMPVKKRHGRRPAGVHREEVATRWKTDGNR
jgi:hypothetical protein